MTDHRSSRIVPVDSAHDTAPWLGAQPSEEPAAEPGAGSDQGGEDVTLVSLGELEEVGP